MIQPGIIEQVCDNNKVHEHQPREHVDSLTLQVPFYRVELNDEEINEVVAALKSGWLTSGPRVRQFEQDFAAAVGAKHAVAVTSCTAALHLALEAVGLRAGQAVLVPTMTFAATAEVVRYFGAVPVLVDCDPVTLNMDLPSAAIRIEEVRTGKLPSLKPDTEIVGIIPVHVGGQMMDVGAVQQFAHQHGLWVVEDAAHAFPAAWRPREAAPWQRCGEGTAEVTC
ncbi:MAG: aminotransferase class I/II-fold pyridoxal phosphate-dependent enzyme, partial [Bryobacteraceae bacterium]|nr:aminotransferase class I/II-fold pyridoxal phosphate-dependent enzyme [Bryobacteraceae bacterium]